MSTLPAPDPHWELHPRLRADTFPILAYNGLQFRLMNDRRFVWILIVPMLEHAEQLHELPPAWRERTLSAMDAASRTLDALFQPDRINVGAIGNVVPQLHVHCVARFHDDAAWPGVVWGAGVREPLPPLELLGRIRPIAAGLAESLARNFERTT
jgi:diadenosine tetraphosphate (Ap4A) HIT family hydrolase